MGVSKSKREEFEQLFKGDFCACIGEVTEKKEKWCLDIKTKR